MTALHRRTPSSAPGLALAGLLAGACGWGVPADPVLLRLGEEEVRRSDLERHLARFESRGGTLDPAVRAALVQPFLEERVQVLEARSRRLVARGASEEEEQRAVQALLAERLRPLRAGDLEIEAHYAAHPEECRSAERVTLSQILLASEADAQEARRQLLRDPGSFGAMARTRSRSPEAGAEGRLGSFERGELPPELEQAAFALSEGGLSPVIKSGVGFHILKLEARSAGRQRSLEECREQIRVLLLRRKSEQAVTQFVRELLSRAEVNHEAVAAVARPR